MSSSFDLDPVSRIVAGAIGEPGRRVFYLQARSADQLVTLLVEKEQVRALAVSIEQMLSVIPEAQEADATPGAEDLEEPLLPEWRVGPMALQYDEDRDRIVFIATEQGEATEEETEVEGATARFVATREQARALAEGAARAVEAGRPSCRFCGLPMDAEGHTCPAMNGHRG
jgi:uncharacterized repeat protein (TIGR03847 family)